VTKAEAQARAALTALLAKNGAKGGRTTGPSKARSPEHYRRLAEMKRAKARKP
jgi:hypothetical protein